MATVRAVCDTLATRLAMVSWAKVQPSRLLRLSLCPPPILFQRPHHSLTFLCRPSLACTMASRRGTRRGLGTAPSAYRPCTSPPSSLAPRGGYADGDADHPMALPTCPGNSIWSCTSSTNFRVDLAAKKPNWTAVARRKSTRSRWSHSLTVIGDSRSIQNL